MVQKLTRIAPAAAAAALLIAVSACSKQPTTAAANAGPPPAPVKVASAVATTLPVEVKTIGNVEAYKTISVKSQVGGTIMRTAFAEGQDVRAGQLLFEIDPRPFQEQIKQLEANMARDQAALKQAEANLARDVAQEKYARDMAKRFEDLTKQGVVAKQQGEQATSDADARTASVHADQAAIDSARAALVADRAALDNAKLQLSYCYIKSPVDGRTGNVNVKQGNLVKANDIELVTITQVHPVYVTFTVPEKQLNAIREKMRTGKLVVRAAQKGDVAAPEEGALTFVDNAVDQATGTIKLKGTFTNSNGRLWPGQFVDVTLTIAQRPNVVAIPQKAVQIGQQGQYVFVVKSDNTVEMRDVVTGDPAGDMVEVQKGVAPGETVVTEGHVRLAPGSRVKVLQS